MRLDVGFNTYTYILSSNRLSGITVLASFFEVYWHHSKVTLRCPNKFAYA